MKFNRNYLLYALTLLSMLVEGKKANAQSDTGLSILLQARDSLLFAAVFKNCDMTQVENTFSAGFEYYQDKGDGNAPLLTSRAEFISNIQRRCAVKTPSYNVRRELVNGSVIVSLINPVTATQTGIQRFFMSAGDKPEQMVEESHFTRVWQLEKGTWKMGRELDYQIFTPSPQDMANSQDSVYMAVLGADSTLFAAYNNQDINTLKNIFSPDLEFYHDKGGLTHYSDNIENFEKHFKDTADYAMRELVSGSVRVYPLNNYGAVETGMHHFYTRINGRKQLTATANFINIWHWTEGHWKLSRVISYDHR